MMSETAEKRPRGRPRLAESRKLPPPITLRLTAEQMALVDALYESDPSRTKAQILREAITKGLTLLAA
jgi:hypothetical protein